MATCFFKWKSRSVEQKWKEEKQAQQKQLEQILDELRRLRKASQLTNQQEATLLGGAVRAGKGLERDLSRLTDQLGVAEELNAHSIQLLSQLQSNLINPTLQSEEVQNLSSNNKSNLMTNNRSEGRKA
eukprot:CAMPEP_0170074178 /NCGR_PEP_ID=MMETSP0019_2-20121128/11514_1 /TAXON_ID=98059 /ORGANISM="Dinobryon sp., Strain UTEXLB2267" /LENGTH=127 /DNA_ID=CAMNT_0010284285 /DNA_START=608 /DNA_END=991 /DNA_ORIENTATION=+